MGKKIWEKCPTTGHKITNSFRNTNKITSQIQRKPDNTRQKLPWNVPKQHTDAVKETRTETCTPSMIRIRIPEGEQSNRSIGRNLMLTSIYSRKMTTFTICRAFLPSRNPMVLKERKKRLFHESGVREIPRRSWGGGFCLYGCQERDGRLVIVWVESYCSR